MRLSFHMAVGSKKVKACVHRTVRLRAAAVPAIVAMPAVVTAPCYLLRFQVARATDWPDQFEKFVAVSTNLAVEIPCAAANAFCDSTVVSV